MAWEARGLQARLAGGQAEADGPGGESEGMQQVTCAMFGRRRATWAAKSEPGSASVWHSNRLLPR